MSMEMCLSHGHGSWSGTWMNVLGDINRHLTMTAESSTRQQTIKRKVASFLRPEIQSLFLYRLSHFVYVKGWHRLSRAIFRSNLQLHKVNISPQSCIGPGCRLPHPPGVTFHGRAGPGLTIYSLAVCTTSDDRLEGRVENGPNLGKNVVLGAHCVLLGPITVGDDSKIVFAVRLNIDVPPAVIVASKVVRLRYQTSESYRQRLQTGEDS